MSGTTYVDVSQYQGTPIDDTYPFRIFCFRTNSGDKDDTLALENARRALSMLERGKLDMVFPYYFFRPGQANCDAHREILQVAGLWNHPRTASMIDVEDANGAITGDHSKEINEEVAKMQGWYGNPKRVFGYLNAVSNAGLWKNIPSGMRFATPNYTYKPGVYTASFPSWMRTKMIAHQYTDKQMCKPWPNGVDHNWSPLTIPQLADALGIKLEGDNLMGNATPGQVSVIVAGAGQLKNGYRNLRAVFKPKNYPASFDTAKEPGGAWPNDVWAALFNEVGWDGYDLSTGIDGVALADIPDTEKRALVGLIRTIGARQAQDRQLLRQIAADVAALKKG